MRMRHYRQPVFLSADDEPVHRIRCPIHGFIRFSENERRVIDHPLFRRLRYIRKLALTELVYPGATHTRFEHSLGVMEIVSRAFDALATKQGDLLEATFRIAEALKPKPMARARQYLRLAGLLHDAGHASFSHAAEEVVHRGLGHEALSIGIVREPQWLGAKLDEWFGDGCADAVANILEGGPPQFHVLHSLVSGEMDADRTDYLLRDSHHCGVEYGRFDFRRMIECLELDDESEALEVALDRDGIHTFEALILARYQMNTQVYYHRVRRIYDLYLARYLQALSEDAPNTPEKILAEDDVGLLARIKTDAEAGSGERREWADRIWNRRHHRVVHETGADANAMDLRRSEEVLRSLQGEYSDVNFIMDRKSPSIHRLLVPEDHAETGRVRLPVVRRGRQKREMGEESQILRRVPHLFQYARIYADLEPQDRALRRKVEEFASRQWRQRGGN